MDILVWKCSECKNPCYEPYVGKGKKSKRFIKPECCTWDESRIDSKWILRKVDNLEILEYFSKYQNA